MVNLLQENIEMKSLPANSTFTIRTSLRSNPKLQKSYFFANAQLKRERYDAE